MHGYVPGRKGGGWAYGAPNGPRYRPVNPPHSFFATVRVRRTLSFVYALYTLKHRHLIPFHAGLGPGRSSHAQLRSYQRHHRCRAHQVAPTATVCRAHGDDGSLLYYIMKLDITVLERRGVLEYWS